MAPFWGAPAREAPGSVPVTPPPPPRRRAPGNPRGPRAPFCRARGRAQGVGESKLDERRAGRGGPQLHPPRVRGEDISEGRAGGGVGKSGANLLGCQAKLVLQMLWEPAVPAAQRRVGVPPVRRRTGGQPWVRAARAAQNSLSPHSRFSIELRRLARNAQSFKPLEGSEPLNVCAVELRAALETSRRSPRAACLSGEHVQADLELGSLRSDVSGLGAERSHRNAAPDGRGDGGALP
ncbi:unnamed protein product [Rangifer tarandus platyrhynchus]|uniref:Uncharacterized protein n=2 Tax=Rangifer tarandus platyrhynchus TaxID=3082113 RepID=A0ABN8ZEN1_RANTA|nr:unnamed protein product [Rangifer tarandus platyrhynchus]CAI9707649.1 unnamed protein product [Rangifer tarandus platyrhynchus]